VFSVFICGVQSYRAGLVQYVKGHKASSQKISTTVFHGIIAVVVINCTYEQMTLHNLYRKSFSSLSRTTFTRRPAEVNTKASASNEQNSRRLNPNRFARKGKG
jgi:hypothetical protein